MAAPWQKRATVGSILQIGISRITKCAIYNGFCKSNHILRSIVAFGVEKIITLFFTLIAVLHDTIAYSNVMGTHILQVNY